MLRTKVLDNATLTLPSCVTLQHIGKLSYSPLLGLLGRPSRKEAVLTRLQKILTAGLSVVLLFVLSLTWVFAHGGDVNLIHACVNDKGSVRIVDANDNCEASKKETPLDWGIVGPAGPQGEAGQAGLSCWDLDGDGEADEEEDINGDDTVDALDCQGPQGEQGPQGAAGVAGIYTRTSTSTIHSGVALDSPAECDSGDTPIGGGYQFDVDKGNVGASYPWGHQWRVYVRNTSTSDFEITVYAVCADTTP